MKIYPAIDLLGGRVVRLIEGDRSQATVYSNDPPAIVRSFVAAGAERVHVVDLDGAFSGTRAHHDTIAGLVQASSAPIQVGGGIRDEAALDAVFAAGVGFAVLGTGAVKNPEFARAACAAHPGRVIVAVDARDGVVAVEGWVESAEVSAVELGRRAAGWGAAGLLYTDVARDGAQVGPNVEATAALAAAVDIPVIASGGVSSLDDVRALAAAGIPAVIIGRALYENRFTLVDAIAAADEA
ncbi:1-(5-phosphoribosyl)-5-[(5-phosphoribosylamino)methylideneamino]imidazole-4-carboxamide isomerase [Haliangium sp.]|uniref:1-(5-phosphoribosyl)-5-[(5- phosphoribosylamino)methylideneamino]imidazole-4- carboxamide isomerase n=1 Tax=Haliangium sp. TaxID=2663208 RepID=UPI003D14CF18